MAMHNTTKMVRNNGRGDDDQKEVVAALARVAGCRHSSISRSYQCLACSEMLVFESTAGCYLTANQIRMFNADLDGYRMRNVNGGGRGMVTSQHVSAATVATTPEPSWRERQLEQEVESLRRLESKLQKLRSDEYTQRVDGERNLRKSLDDTRVTLQGEIRQRNKLSDANGSLRSENDEVLKENGRLRREVDRLERRLKEATAKKGPYAR